MLKLRRFALAAILLMGATVVPALAQGPLHKRINFTMYPVLEGWNIPGDDGWEVIGGVARLRGVNSRYEARAMTKSRRTY